MATVLALLSEYQPLLVLALLVLLVLQAQWIRSLRGSVDAQGKAIEAQQKTIDQMSTLASTMKSVLESTDEARMLGRLTSYKKLVEEEMAIALARQTRVLEDRVQSHTEGLAKGAGDVIGRLVFVIGQLLPYCPRFLRDIMLAQIRAPIPDDASAEAFREAAVASLDPLALAAPEISRGLGGLMGLYDAVQPMPTWLMQGTPPLMDQGTPQVHPLPDEPRQ